MQYHTTHSCGRLMCLKLSWTRLLNLHSLINSGALEVVTVCSKAPKEYLASSLSGLLLAPCQLSGLYLRTIDIFTCTKAPHSCLLKNKRFKVKRNNVVSFPSFYYWPLSLFPKRRVSMKTDTVYYFFNLSCRSRNWCKVGFCSTECSSILYCWCSSHSLEITWISLI